MADEVDQANDQVEYLVRVALHRRPALSTAVSATECEDCESPIPEARRAAVSGCMTCIDCQSLRERRG
ncbi:TraR/DksA C4-type zinc finger protein [Pseudomonas sp. 21LCFQ02]|uniref:TraR/DksA C4-type zinc finger protein n=1 Tax=Pseudomonas sp. 21LCFQ02 TaxID=2957505 RepID=UPI00209B44FE|nr:TraR/DksA C4-type zinc finger protein [Pseudomonas sp. 21LCFQ02]MCO8167852.1 TraR/DksA C4-type zinc finger protein [Pseudomonas sp. 21LCFQ02]